MQSIDDSTDFGKVFISLVSLMFGFLEGFGHRLVAGSLKDGIPSGHVDGRGRRQQKMGRGGQQQNQALHGFATMSCHPASTSDITAATPFSIRLIAATIGTIVLLVSVSMPMSAPVPDHFATQSM